MPTLIVWNKTVYMFKMDLALNNLRMLICIKPKQYIYMCVCVCVCVCVCMCVISTRPFDHCNEYIITIMSCRQHGYPWCPLATSPYRSSLLAGLQGYIPYPHISAVCKFELDVLLFLGHMRRFIGVNHWWVHPCFSSSVLRVWLV